MSHIYGPKQNAIFKIRKLLTHIEFEIMEDEPCEQCLFATSSLITRILFEQFAEGVKADEIFSRHAISQLETRDSSICASGSVS